MAQYIDPNQPGNPSLWAYETAQDTAEYLTSWLGWHNASTNEMRW